MAELKPDGEIYYSSAGEFLTDFDTHISKGGLYLDTSQDWPLRRLMKFVIRTEGIGSTIEISAEVVFLGEKKVGLQLQSTPDTKANLESYRSLVQSLASGATQPEAAAGAPPTGEQPAEEPEAISGQIVAPRNLDEFRSATPAGLGTAELRSVTLFKLVASIAASHRALALTVLHKGEPICFRFNDKGNLVQFLAPGAGEDLLDRLVAERLITRHAQQEVAAELSETKFAEAVLL